MGSNDSDARNGKRRNELKEGTSLWEDEGVEVRKRQPEQPNTGGCGS
jgi:hypothetical protein